MSRGFKSLRFLLISKSARICVMPNTLDELRPEYIFDYSQAKPNRFTSIPSGSRVVLLEPDVAQVFATPEQVNAVLRALIATMPKNQAA